MSIIPGATVFHRKSGETWVVSAVNPHKPEEFIPAGWPETLSDASEVDIVEEATPNDDESMTLLAANIATRDSLRCAWARTRAERMGWTR